MAEQVPRPYFAEVTPEVPLKPDPDAPQPEEIAAWSSQVEQGIRDDPYRYRRALTALGEAATSDRTDTLLSLNLEPRDLGAAIRIHTYFASQGDRSVIYDDATEEALKNDQNYRDALAEHRRAVARTVSTSSQSHRRLTNPNAAPARDRVRRLSLAFYIDRSAAWGESQSQQQAS